MQTQLKPAKILLVDDIKANVAILRALLQQEFEIDYVYDGESVLRYVETTLPDLILLDIIMPNMDGYEVCRHLKANPHTADIPVIFITALGEEEDESKGLNLGAVDYITKPIKPAIVKARIRTHLNLKSVCESLEAQNKTLLETANLRETVERIGRHDIKTPLNGIINYPEMLLEDDNLTEEQRDVLKIMMKQGRKILAMINNSLDLYKMEMQTYIIEPVRVDVIAIFQSIMREIYNFTEKKFLSTDIFVNGKLFDKGDSFTILGETLLCYSMLANLYKNAVEASPTHAKITLSLTEKEQGCYITIHNQGVVPERIQSCFFDKYITADKQDGTGLGTYSAKLMAKTLGGMIEMQTAVTTGTTLTVCLPKVTE